MGSKQMVVTLQLCDAVDPTYGWSTHASLKVSDRNASQLLRLADHRPIELRGFRNEDGFWELWLIDLSP